MSEPFTRWTELEEWKERAEQAERALALMETEREGDHHCYCLLEEERSRLAQERDTAHRALRETERALKNAEIGRQNDYELWQQAEHDLVECRERIGHLTSANIECGRKVEQAERRLADVRAERDRSVKYGMALDQSIDVLVEERDTAHRALAEMREALAPGTPERIFVGLMDECVTRGIGSPYAAKHVVSQVINEIDTLRSQLADAHRALAEKERQHAHQLAALKVTWEAKNRALAEARAALTKIVWALENGPLWHFTALEIARAALSPAPPASGANPVDSRDPTCESEPR